MSASPSSLRRGLLCLIMISFILTIFYDFNIQYKFNSMNINITQKSILLFEPTLLQQESDMTVNYTIRVNNNDSSTTIPPTSTNNDNMNNILNEIVVVVKTGKETIDARVPIQLDTMLKYIPNIVILSDSDTQVVGSYRTVDMAHWDIINHANYEDRHKPLGEWVAPPPDNDDQMEFLRLQDIGKAPKSHKPENPFESEGWTLDKKKNIPGLRYTYEQYPNMKWYILIDDDTYLHIGNLINLLSQYSHEEDYYIGGGMQFFSCGKNSSGRLPPGGDYYFAHGGSGILLSQATMAKLHNVSSKCYALFGSCWAGDVMVGVCLKEVLNIELTQKYDVFHAETPYHLKWSSGWYGDPCAKPITFHHLKPHEIRMLHNAELANIAAAATAKQQEQQELQNGTTTSTTTNDAMNNLTYDPSYSSLSTQIAAATITHADVLELFFHRHPHKYYDTLEKNNATFRSKNHGLYYYNHVATQGIQDAQFMADFGKKVQNITSPQQCVEVCAKNPKCKYWSWSKKSQSDCHVGENIPSMEYNKPFISGLYPGRYTCKAK